MARAAGALLCTLIATMVFAAPARAAAPWLIVVTGEPLEGTAYLDDWDDNLLIYQEVVNTHRTVADGDVAGRPFLDLALFWGSNGRGRPLSKLGPEQADQHGRFFPAANGAPAVIHLPLAEYPDPVRATPTILSLLTQHGVPVRLEPESARNDWLLPGAIGGGMAAALLGLGALVAWRRTHHRAARA